MKVDNTDVICDKRVKVLQDKETLSVWKAHYEQLLMWNSIGMEVTYL